MVLSDALEVWNLTPGVAAISSAQTVFNVVGRLKQPEAVEKFTFSLNGSVERPIFFNSQPKRSGRLERFGDFNIDTISTHELQPENILRFFLRGKGSSVTSEEIAFPARPIVSVSPEYRLDLSGVSVPEQVGQVVDGKWQIGRDVNGETCLEIGKTDAGLDRIILFGNHAWNGNYEITARLSVAAWSDRLHNIGLLFCWNPHRQGDGTFLPTEWTTGLGYYYSHCAGLRLRYGVDVHLDEKRNKVGDYVLAERALSPWRGQMGRLINNFLPVERLVSQIIPGRQYHFQLLITPQVHTLAVFQAGQRKPTPQLSVHRPRTWLQRGAVGLIAHHCAARLYEFDVKPAR
jgi:hypothetical protein